MKSYDDQGEKACVKSSSAKGFDGEPISQLAVENPFFSTQVQEILPLYQLTYAIQNAQKAHVKRYLLLGCKDWLAMHCMWLEFPAKTAKCFERKISQKYPSQKRKKEKKTGNPRSRFKLMTLSQFSS